MPTRNILKRKTILVKLFADNIVSNLQNSQERLGGSVLSISDGQAVEPLVGLDGLACSFSTTFSPSNVETVRPLGATPNQAAPAGSHKLLITQLCRDMVHEPCQGR